MRMNQSQAKRKDVTDSPIRTRSPRRRPRRGKPLIKKVNCLKYSRTGHFAAEWPIGIYIAPCRKLSLKSNDNVKSLSHALLSFYLRLLR